MRELTYAGKEKLEWRQRTEPRLEAPTDALVRPVAATTCDLDKLIIGGRAPLDPPFAIGHECIGELVEAGDGVGQSIVVVADGCGSELGEMSRAREMPKEHFSYFAYRA